VKYSIMIGVPTTGNPSSYYWYAVLARYMAEASSIAESATNFVRDYSVATARERIAKEAVRRGVDFVLFIDDDVIPTVNPITNFLSYAYPVMCGVYFEKNMKGLNLHVKRGEKYVRLKPDELPNRLFNVDACGLGLAMIHTSIFEALIKKNRQMFTYTVRKGEDIHFFEVLNKELGIKPLVIPSIKAYHVIKAPFVITPEGKNEMMAFI